MSFTGSSGGSLGGAIGLGLGGLFGGAGSSAPKVNFTPPGFAGGGLATTYGPGGYSVSPTQQRQDLVGGVASTFGQQAGELGALRQTVAPGFSDLRNAQMNTLENQRTAAIGNLRDNLARRRILGSSFASDALSRADQEYAQTKANVQAQTYLQELDASNKLIQQQYEASRGQFTTGLNELNLEAGLAADLTGKATNALASVATAQAKLDADAAAGKGKFFGTLGQMAGSALGTIFGGPAGTAIGGALGRTAGGFFDSSGGSTYGGTTGGVGMASSGGIGSA